MTPLHERLAAIFAVPELADAWVGVRVETLRGDVLADINGAKCFVPASNMKLFATAMALDLLGAEYRFETPLIAMGPVAEGTLRGDLLIVGSGDPTIGAWDEARGCYALEVLDEWAAAVKAAGVHTIAGEVIVDGSLLGDEPLSDGWELFDLPDLEACPVTAFAVAENSFHYTLSGEGVAPGGIAHLAIQPAEYPYPVGCEVHVDVADSADGSRLVPVRAVGSDEALFRGHLRADAAPVRHRGSVRDGLAYGLELFRQALQRAGIKIVGLRIGAGTEGNPIAEIHRHRSAPLVDIVRSCNLVSNNFIADMLLHATAAFMVGEGSFAGGIRTANEWFVRMGLPFPESFRIVDGSGLARRNLVQPCQITALLRMQEGRNRAQRYLRGTLPISGETPDLAIHFPRLPKGRVQAKTGLIPQARALSGYITTDGGETLVFSIIVNNYSIDWRHIDRYIESAVAALI